MSQQAAARLPRVALLAFCAAYVLPGLIGRDPWRSADVTAFGYMANLARGVGTWLSPTIAGQPAEGALLPYWLGAASIWLLQPWVEPALAARIPFALLTLGILALTWYTCYHLARTEAAQPLAFAFGGEARPVDYSRAVADGAVLALIGTLGLLQLGHETTPELVQLCAVTAIAYALASCASRRWEPRVAAFAGMLALALSGAPAIAVATGAIGAALCLGSSDAPTRRFAPWLLGATAAAAIVATGLDAWSWRPQAIDTHAEFLSLGRLLIWFTWPTLPLAIWTLWRWRAHLSRRHIGVPLTSAGVGIIASVAMGGQDRVLLLALPGLAVLAAFALPTLRRSASAAIDWFSVFFFSICAVAIWVVYTSMQTGVPAAPVANVRRLAPAFEPSFSGLALVVAIVATVAWLWLVAWRTGRHRHPLWKSMVLPAAGVSLCWTLLMTLWLPPLDHARSFRPLVERLLPHLPKTCVEASQTPRALQASLEQFSRLEVIGAPGAPQAKRCDARIAWVSRSAPRPKAPAGWVLATQVRHPADRSSVLMVYRRAPAVD